MAAGRMGNMPSELSRLLRANALMRGSQTHGGDAAGTAGLWPRGLQRSHQPGVSHQGRVSLGSAWLCLAPCPRVRLCLRAGGGNLAPHPSNLHSLFSALVVLRTFYLQGLSRADSAAWYADIQASAGGRGNALRDQQLSRGDIPIIVDSCIAFITQYGESSVVASLPEHPQAHPGQ